MPLMILPDLSNLAFSDFVGIFSLPNSKLITISFETVLDVNGLPTVRLTLGYGRKVLYLSYLPVAAFLLDLAETFGNRLRSPSKAVSVREVAPCSSFEHIDAVFGLCSTSETSCWMWLIAVLAMGRIEAGSLLELFDGAMFVSESRWQHATASPQRLMGHLPKLRKHNYD